MTPRTPTNVSDRERIELGPEAGHLARGAYDGLFELLEALEPQDWRQPTVCEGWDVADMVRHLLGAAKATASMWEGARQMILGVRSRDEHGGSYLDALNHLQVHEHREVGPQELLAQLKHTAPKAVRGRMRLPKAFGGIPIPVPSGGSTPEGAPSRLTVGELYAVTYTRDTWLHRTDIARATGLAIELDPDDDGRIVEDVVIEWARHHGRPFELTLAGPAGGHYVAGSGGPHLEYDPVDFCWILSGRAEPGTSQPGDELLEVSLLF